MELLKLVAKIVWWLIAPSLIMVWLVFVTCASIKVFQDVRANKQPEENYTMTYHNSRIYIDGNKTEYTLKEVSEGVYVIRKGE